MSTAQRITVVLLALLVAIQPFAGLRTDCCCKASERVTAAVGCNSAVLAADASEPIDSCCAAVPDQGKCPHGTAVPGAAEQCRCRPVPPVAIAVREAESRQNSVAVVWLTNGTAGSIDILIQTARREGELVFRPTGPRFLALVCSWRK